MLILIIKWGDLMPQEYIVYITNGGSREIAIVDGQPYYKSTGISSGSAGVWFPFIMISDSKPAQMMKKLEVISDTIGVYQLADLLFLQYNHIGYIIKYDNFNLQKSIPDIDKGALYPEIQDDRIPCKSNLIASSQLGGGQQFSDSIFKKAKLSESEIQLARIPIQFSEKPNNILSDPALVNQWLLMHGATLLCRMIPLQTEEKIQEQKMEEGLKFKK